MVTGKTRSGLSSHWSEGVIVNISADESILGNDGNIDAAKLQPIIFDPVHNTYLKVDEKVGNAFHDGSSLK